MSDDNGDTGGRREERELKRKKRLEEWKSRWTYRIQKLQEKTALMLAKAKRWKWLAIVLGLLAVIGMAVLSKLGWLGSLFGK